MYLWRLRYPSQTVKKRIDGRPMAVHVIAGAADFISHEKARTHARKLEEFWPGLRYQIQPIERDAALVNEMPRRAAQGGAR
ncbi:MAG: hypothetical protein ACYC9Q_09275 [Bacillota bacterium]